MFIDFSPNNEIRINNKLTEHNLDKYRRIHFNNRLSNNEQIHTSYRNIRRQSTDVGRHIRPCLVLGKIRLSIQKSGNHQQNLWKSLTIKLSQLTQQNQTTPQLWHSWSKWHSRPSLEKYWNKHHKICQWSTRITKG